MKENLMLWLAGVGGTLGFGLALWGIKKFGPAMMHRLLDNFIKRAMDLDEGDAVVNEARKRMILAQMVYLELKIPDRGQGAARKAMLEASLGSKAGPICEELISQLDDELKKLRDQYK